MRFGKPHFGMKHPPLEDMPNPLVTPCAGHRQAISPLKNQADGGLMAADAVLLEVREVLRTNPEDLNILKSKGYRMTNPIFHFRRIFPDRAIGDMATVAGHATVAGNAPTVETVTHDMAIHARFRVV